MFAVWRTPSTYTSGWLLWRSESSPRTPTVAPSPLVPPPAPTTRRRTPAPRRAAYWCARPPHARAHELRPAAGAAPRVRRRRAAPRRLRAGLRPGIPRAVDSWRGLLECEELPGYARCNDATSV